ncbi:transcription elongation factor, mitochondrial-like isoform X2 [Vespa mandarinia]|uniref:transcription elongation factor, mitochondrial-like isoform X2 n=1 Tax=Vespa mandarinia TaxID=7446 RepID=UPI00161096F9|nr:transcription elongation factor, mitochondrial-like isoform X2 [Vespa mandarinia]
MLIQQIKCHDNVIFNFMTTKVGRIIANYRSFNLQKLDMFRQYTNCNLSVKQIRFVLYPYSRLMHSNRRNKNELHDNYPYNNYILKILNDETIDYFKRYRIPQSLAIKLHLYREKYGSYKSLKDILEVQDMTKELLNIFIQSIINDKQFKIMHNFKKSIILPLADIPQDQISTILGIHVGTNIISWTLLESEENVLDWNYENFLQIPKNDDTFGLFNLAWKLKFKIPKADVYVMDELNFNYNLSKSIKHTRIFLQKEKLKAMILAFLSEKNLSKENNETSSLPENVYLLKHEKLVKLFDLYIGNEIISSKNVINRLLCEKDCINNKEKDPVGVYIQKDIMHRYNNQVDYIKDQMNWSLLIGLTFLQLGVLGKYDYDFI